MSRKITIDPVTRIEGHAKITVYLGGDGNIYPKLIKSSLPGSNIGKIENFSNLNRVDVPKIDPNIRKENFDDTGC